MDRKSNREWWKSEEDDIFELVVSSAIDLQQRDARTRDLIAWRDLYIDAPREDWMARGLFRDRRARLNAVQNIVDAAHARLAKNRTRPWLVTSEGDWEAQQRAKLTTMWLDGLFENLDVYTLGSDVLHDALVFGTGALKFFERDGAPACELAWTGDLFVDRREERYRNVRTLYQIVGVDRGVLKAQFPKAADKIDESEGYTDLLDPTDSEPGPADLVLVVEAWRLPDSKKKPGRHVICTEKATLLDEKWKKNTFPFEFLHWSRDPLRFWGQGMVERASGMQAELNSMSAVLEDSYRLCPPASIWVQAGSQVNQKQVTNEPWKVYTHDGPNPPTILTPSPIAADFSAREETILRRIPSLQGLSELAVQSMKPAGLNSGKALTIHQNIESERFYVQAKAYEQFYVGVAKQFISLADDLVASGKGDALTIYGGKKELTEIAYADAMLKDKPYQLRVFPVSSLPNEPAGRVEHVSELVGLGAITDPSDVRELLDFPDLDRFNSVESAGRQLVEKRIGQALKGETVAAHPLMPLEYLIRRATLEHDLAEQHGAPEEALQALRDLISHAETLLPPPPAPPMDPSMMGGPMGPGVPPDPSMMPPAPMGPEPMPPAPMEPMPPPEFVP